MVSTPELLAQMRGQSSELFTENRGLPTLDPRGEPVPGALPSIFSEGFAPVGAFEPDQLVLPEELRAETERVFSTRQMAAPENPAAIVRQRPDEMIGLQRNWQQVYPVLVQAGVSRGTINSLYRFSLLRANQGKTQPSKEEILRFAEALEGGEATTGKPDDPIWTDMLNDLKLVATGLNPLTMAQGIGRELGALGGGRDEGPEPRNIFEQPGIRLLPGSWTAGNILAGTPGELAEHPLLTFLDLAPASTKAVTAGARAGARMAKARWPAQLEAIARSPAGTFFTAKLGRVGRDLGRRSEDAASLARAEVTPMITRLNHAAEDAFANPAELRGFTEQMQQGRPGWTDSLTPARREYLSAYENLATFLRVEGERFGAISRMVVDEKGGGASLVKAGVTPEPGKIITVPRERAQAHLRARAAGEDAQIVADFVDHLYRAEFDAAESRLFVYADRVNTEGSYASQSKLGLLRNAFDTVRSGESTASQAISALAKADDQLSLDVLAQSRKAIEATFETLDPFEYRHLTNEAFRARLNSKLETMFRDDRAAFEHQADLLAEGRLDDLAIDEATREGMRRQVGETWADLHHRGLRPYLVMHSQPQTKLTGKVSLRPSDPAWWNERTWDLTPTFADSFVGVTHATWQQISKTGSEAFEREIVNDLVTDRVSAEANIRNQVIQDLGGRSKYRRQGALSADEAAAGMFGPDEVNAGVSRRLELKYEPYDPDRIARGGGPLDWTGKPDERVIEKAYATAIRDLTPNLESFANTVLDAPTRLFKTTVLALNPSWHANQFLGNAVLMSMRQPAGWAHMGRAWRIVRDVMEGKTPANLTQNQLDDLARLNIGGKAEFLQDRSVAGQAKVHAQLAAGRTAAKWWQQAIGGGRRVRDKLYEVGGMGDDMFRVATYLAEGGGDEALSAAAKTIQTYRNLTPFERNTLRFVIPFYSWVRHIVPYALSYPWDHPWRMSVMANLSQAIKADLGSAYPISAMEGLVTWDEETGEGSRWNFPGNPFDDFASYFTIAGFLNQLHPAAGALLEAVGIDPLTSTAELYPDTIFNPETGRLETVQEPVPGMPWRTAKAMIPQLELADLLNSGSELRGMMQRNPEAASRRIRGRMGLGLLSATYRNIDVYRQAIVAEKARTDQERKDLGEALRTGNFGIARRWPGLEDDIALLEELKGEHPELFTGYAPAQQDMNVARLLFPGGPPT